jgi:hypothetical protein
MALYGRVKRFRDKPVQDSRVRIREGTICFEFLVDPDLALEPEEARRYERLIQFGNIRAVVAFSLELPNNTVMV